MKQIALTVGYFDGVHLGHQLLFSRMRETGCRTVAITFSNHLAEILGRPVPQLLTPLSLKLSLLSQFVDETIVLAFTPEMARQTAREFLLPYQFQHLFLGEGASMGYRRQDTTERLHELGQERDFEMHVIPKLIVDGEPISSSRIRTLIAQGEMEKTEQLLGRSLCLSPAVS